MTESKGKIWSKGKLRPDQIVGMSGGFCLSNTILNNSTKEGNDSNIINHSKYNNLLLSYMHVKSRLIMINKKITTMISKRLRDSSYINSTLNETLLSTKFITIQ